MQEKIKKFIFENNLLWSFVSTLRKLVTKQGECSIENKGRARLIKDIGGGIGNSIVIESGAVLHDTTIRIRGNNNTIVFGRNCVVGKECSFWMEGNNICIEIGEATTFTQRCHLNAQEDGMKILVGRDCMFSNQIIVRTSDSHPIYDCISGERLNCAQSVTIGEHVWIAPNSKIMKGSRVGDGAIIGSDTMVTKDIPAHTLVVGHPARVVKENVRWTREALF